jgi:hypothetical protein
MNAASCYRPVDLQLCQGDILERVPHLYLKDFPGPIRKTTGTGSRIVYELEELAPGAQATAPEEGILVPAHCQITRAMLLTYDCEIDKDRKHRMVALIRPLPASILLRTSPRFGRTGVSPSSTFRPQASSSRKVMSISAEFAPSRQNGWTLRTAWRR